MPPREKGKRHRSQERPTPLPPKTQSVALATIRNATVTFGAGYGALSVPVERHITQYLRQQRLFVVGGWHGRVLRSCYSLDVAAGMWVEEAPMTKGRHSYGLCVFWGEMWAVGGHSDNTNNTLRSCARFDEATLGPKT